MHCQPLTSQPTYRITQADPIEQCTLSIRSLFWIRSGASLVSQSARLCANPSPTLIPPASPLGSPIGALIELPQPPVFVPTGGLQ